MSIESLKSQLEQDLSQVRFLLPEARARLTEAIAGVSSLEREEMALQSALDVLSNKVAARPTTLGAPGENRQIFQYAAAPKEMATLNGEPVVLEPGFRIGRNSFGEECIVPTNASDYPTMAEPTKPNNVALVLPPLSAGEGFDSPENQL